MNKRKGFRAWLITWEWCGDHAKPEERVVEILSPRISSERVREIVELIYHRHSSPSEKVAWRLQKKQQAYPAEFSVIEGVKREGQIHCGHNPWLLARLVDDLAVSVGADGKEVVSWIDRHAVPQIAERIRNMRDGKRFESRANLYAPFRGDGIPNC